MRGAWIAVLIIAGMASVMLAGTHRPDFVKARRSEMCWCPEFVAISDAMPPSTGSDDRGVTWLQSYRYSLFPEQWTDGRQLYSACYPGMMWTRVGKCVEFQP